MFEIRRKLFIVFYQFKTYLVIKIICRKVQFEDKIKELPEFHKYAIKQNGGEFGTK